MRYAHRFLAALLCSLAACSETPAALPAAGAASGDGLAIEQEGDIVYFRIPLAQTAEPDRAALFALTQQRFREGMAEMHARVRAELGSDSPLLAPLADFSHQTATAELIERVLASVGPDLGETAGLTPARAGLPHWRRYLQPQAYLAFVGGAVRFGMGVSGGASVLLMVVAQPWLEVAVDARSGRELSRHGVVDVQLLGVPGLEVGMGEAGGAALQLGAGVVWGPLTDPRDLTGLALGVAACGSVPLLGGGRAALLSTLDTPPLLYAMAGYHGGAATLPASIVHMTGQLLLDIDAFLEYVKGAI